jgi:copper resistance protein B
MNAMRLALLALLLLAVAAPAQEADHEQVGDAHADHAQMDRAAPAPQPDSVRSPVPPLTDADRAAALLPHGGHASHDNGIHGYLLLDRLEYRNSDPGSSLAWNAKGWFGTDLDRLWLRSEGERADGELEAADAELLYGRSISPWLDAVGGVRTDFRPGDGRSWIALGLQGLAPQRFEIAATAYVGTHRRSAARFEAEYRLLFTNRLMLQPVLELWLYGRDDAARGVGAGVSTAETGLRLRYEFTRRFAPYLGIEYERAIGDTASLRRAAGAAVSDSRLVLGLRTWF